VHRSRGATRRQQEFSGWKTVENADFLAIVAYTTLLLRLFESTQAEDTMDGSS
jgi:hypothetical protein